MHDAGITQPYLFRFFGGKRALPRRRHLGTLWNTVATTTRLNAVVVKTFLGYGMLLNVNAAMRLAEVDSSRARGIRSRLGA